MCWICDQKAEYKLEKLRAVRLEAYKKAINEQTIIKIWKEGARYNFGTDPGEYAGEVFEYISQHSPTPG